MSIVSRIGIASLVCVLTSTTAGVASAQTPESPPTLADVAVAPDSLGAAIPRGFVGFSLEVSTAGQGIGAFQGPQASRASSEQPVYALGRPGAPNEDYFRFMRILGPGILRLGGNSQDNTCWDQAAAPHPDACQAELDAAEMRLWGKAARESGWRLIVGLNLKQNGPAWALSEVTEGIAREISASSVFALELGNEPDLFARTPLRPRGYSFTDYVQDFRAYLAALQSDSAARHYAVVGPATCCGWRNAEHLGAFIDSIGSENLRWVTVHNYSATTCGGQTVSAAHLLSPELMGTASEEAASLARAAQARGVPIAMAETNSASCGGMPGVSNAFTSALWGLDYAFNLAADGFVHVDLHTSYRPGGGSSYNPIDTYVRRDTSGATIYRNVAEPLYYGLYLFSQEAAGHRLLPAHIESPANVTSYAVSDCAGCAVTVFVLNKDTTAAGTVRIRLGRRMGAARLLLLRAPTLGSLAPDVRYGGRQFDSSGGLGVPEETAVSPAADGSYDFTLPNAAIARLTIARAEW